VSDKQKITPGASEKRLVLEAVFSQIDKQYGKGSIMLLGQAPLVAADAI